MKILFPKLYSIYLIYTFTFFNALYDRSKSEVEGI